MGRDIFNHPFFKQDGYYRFGLWFFFLCVFGVVFAGLSVVSMVFGWLSIACLYLAMILYAVLRLFDL